MWGDEPRECEQDGKAMQATDKKGVAIPEKEKSRSAHDNYRDQVSPSPTRGKEKRKSGTQSFKNRSGGGAHEQEKSWK